MNTKTLKELKTKDDIRDLMARYVRHADNKEWEKLAGLFVPDGTFTPLNVEGLPILTMVGRDQIFQTIWESVGNATAIHHLFSYEVDIQSDDHVNGVFAMEDYLIRPEDQQAHEKPDAGEQQFKSMHGFGHYHVEFIKVDGEWSIAGLVQTRIKLDFTY
ncbi:nuclear transport factor 2 family protein [Mucilaginibacter conchicola]|uniref:Nuclear transport factor 2 family protein n=1 Tax=Mucilaginibacter conchicola TaxID=2303333 RepID=A0A372NMR3_9SPHI|nr:nuclear transport factor 2 family protein [Mucilaginibacter conchicola]RFZ90239.1 nuclear transport factor 2 family protein [Mucilaginibacter conchicola]